MKIRTQDYLVNIEVRFSVVDLSAVESEKKGEAVRQALIALQQKRLAGIEAARKADKNKESE